MINAYFCVGHEPLHGKRATAKIIFFSNTNRYSHVPGKIREPRKKCGYNFDKPPSPRWYHILRTEIFPAALVAHALLL